MKRGISLPEMLVALAIMGCFIAILAVRVMPLVDQERDGRFEADMRIIAGAMENCSPRRCAAGRAGHIGRKRLFKTSVKATSERAFLSMSCAGTRCSGRTCQGVGS